MTSLLAQIRKSRLLEWLIAYLALAWLVAQIVSIIAEVWGVSEVFQRRAHVALAFGIPAIAVLAWFHGEKGEQRFSRGEIFVLAALFGLAAIAVPSVGTAGPTAILGIPSSVVLPCSLVTMIVIPAWLIFLSVYRDQQDCGNGGDVSPSYEEDMDELWQKIVTSVDQRHFKEIRDHVARLLTRYPESQELKALHVVATRAAKGLAGAIADDMGTSDEDASIPESWGAEDGESKHDFEHPTAPVIHGIEIPESISVADLAQRMDIKGSEVVRLLFNMGAMVTYNQVIGRDTAMLVVEKSGHIAKPIDYEITGDKLLEKTDSSMRTGGKKSDHGLLGTKTPHIGRNQAASANEPTLSAHRIRQTVRRIGRELKRRNIARAIVIYAVVILAASTFSSVAYQPLGYSTDLRSLAVVSIVFGFSILVVLFWYHGHKKTDSK